MKFFMKIASIIDNIKLSDLDPFYYIVLVAIVCSYFLIQPLVSYFVQLRSIKFLSFLVSSLLVLVSFCFALLLMNVDHLLLNVMKITLQCLAVFGCGLALLYTITKLVKAIRKSI